MKKDMKKFKAAKETFNTIKIIKGQYTNIATCDPDGNPDVAPIGSMRVVDENTVHVLQGYLHKTLKNLERNPKVAFSVCLRPKLFDLIDLLKQKDNDVMGYQVYGELVRVDDTKEAIEREYLQLMKRVPFPFRGLFLKFCQRNLKRLLTFRITGVREIGVPS